MHITTKNSQPAAHLARLTTVCRPTAHRTAEQVRLELKRKGISISQWATSNGFNTNLVYEVLSGKRACNFGQSHRIAIALGIKAAPRGHGVR